LAGIARTDGAGVCNLVALHKDKEILRISSAGVERELMEGYTKSEIVFQATHSRSR